LREPQPDAPRRSLGRLVAALAALCLAAGLVTAGLLAQTSQSTVLAGGGALAGIAALVIAGPLIAGPLAHLMTAPMTDGPGRPGRDGVTARLARDNTTGNLRRTAATASTLVIGLAVAGTVIVIAASASASVQNAIGGSRADLYLQGSVSPGLARAVAARHGVRAVMRLTDPLVEVAGTETRVAGVDPASAPLLIDFGVPGATIAALRGDRLLVSAGEAGRHGWVVGSHVTINFGQGPPRSLAVAGIFTDKRFLGDDYLLPITTMFRDMSDQSEDADSLLVRAGHGTGPRALRAAIAPLFRGDPGVTLQTGAQYELGRGDSDLGHILGLLVALVALTSLIATLGIANMLALSLTERTRELGVMRALGLTRHQLAAMIRIESVITCLLGALPGMALGVGTGAALAATRDQTGVATIDVPLGQIAAVLALACLAGLLAAALPARHAARLAILQAISQ